MRKSNVVVLFLLTLLVIGTAGTALAQQSASITGVVTDPTGAVIPGAEVKVLDTKTGKEVTTKTDASGGYRITSLVPGPGYRVTVTFEGFRTYTVQEVHLGVATVHTLNVTMEVGTVAETVTVESTGEATLNVVDSSIGNVLEERRIDKLPIQFRDNPSRLLSLQPGVVAGDTGDTRSSDESFNRDGSVTGSRADQMTIYVDGRLESDLAGNFAFSQVIGTPVDSLQEFRTITQNPTASEGRASGGQVFLKTKSGGNAWHGSVYEYHRNHKTAANSFFNNKAGVDKPKLIRNQFGFAVGGPIIKDHLFFFFNYDGRRDRRDFSNTPRVVPLASVSSCNIPYRNNTGGISVADATAIQALDPLVVGCNAEILNVLNDRYPVGDATLGGNGVTTGGFRFNSPNPLDQDIYLNRVDAEFGKHTVWGSWSYRDFEQTRSDGPIQQFPGDPPSTFGANKPYGFSVGHIWRATSRITNDFTFSFVRQNFQFSRIDNPSFPNQFNFVGIDDPFVELDEQGRVVEVPVIKDDFTVVAGSHTFQAGGSIRPIRQKSNLTNDFNFVDIGLGGTTTALNDSLRPADIEDSQTARDEWDEMFPFLLGRFASISTNFNYDVAGSAFPPGTGKRRNFAYNEYEWYVQDYWRLHPTLTVNFGLRWSYYSVPYEKNGFQAANDTDFTNLMAIRVANAQAGVSGSDAEPFLRYDLAGKANDALGFYEPDLDNFAPSAAFAWNPRFRDGVGGFLFGDGKTVLRGGGRLVYDRVAGAITFIQDQLSYLFDNSDLVNFGALNPVTALLNDPRFTGFSSVPNVTTAPVISRPFIPFGGDGITQFNYAVAKNFEVPYAITWDLSLQREIPGNMIVEVAYASRRGKKLFSQADAGQLLDFVDPASGQALIAAFRNVQLELLDGTSPFGVTDQDWFENQMSDALGAPCGLVFGVSCTVATAFFFEDLVRIGDMADTMVFLQFFGLLNPNVGNSSVFSSNNYITNLHQSEYHGLLLSLRKRYSQGLQFDFNYTWSHSLDTNSNVTNTILGGTVCNLVDIRACYASSDFDIRHFINSNWYYDLPFGTGRALGSGVPGWLNHIIGGWTATGILTYRTGFPMQTRSNSFPYAFNFGAFDGGYPATLIGSSGLGRDVHSDSSGNIQFFADPTVALDSLRHPIAGEVGTRNAIRGPHLFNLDFGLLKEFKMPWAENHRLTFRWEMYNMFNTVNWSDPNLNIDSSAFGRITRTATDPRVMQFALRYDF